MSDRNTPFSAGSQVLRPLFIDGAEGPSRVPRFRPLFPASTPDPEVPAKASDEEPVSRSDAERMADQWRAKLDEAERVLREAYQQAEAVEAEARERGYQAGYDRGYAEGHAEGIQAANQVLDEEVGKIRAIAQAITRARQELLMSLEPEVVSLSLAIAKKVIGEEALHNEEVIAHMVQKAIYRMGQQGPYRIRLNPLDAQRLMDRWETRDELEGAEWELVPDEEIAVGGCIIESGVASIDARLETQLDLITHTLLEGQDALLG